MLSVLCVTKAEPFAWSFLRDHEQLARYLGAEFVLASDGYRDLARMFPLARVLLVESKGYIESVLDQAVHVCSGDFILRLDDDESCSGSLVQWLSDKAYLHADHWKFPRMHLWPDEQHYITNMPLWPDHQTRLSVRAKSGGRHTIHAGSPFGGGEECPYPIRHHKFIVKTPAQRRAIAARYDAVGPGLGTGAMLPFNVPEDILQLETASL
jgi:hypothetical protein